MKRFLLFGLSSFFSLVLTSVAFGQVTPAKMTSTAKPSSTIEGMKHLEPPSQQPAPPSASLSKPTLPPPVKLPSLSPQQANYLHPGILVYLNGKWEGSDHLLNISSNIGVYISLVKPEAEILDITEAQLQKEVEAIFAQANIRPQTLSTQGKPPLPAFEIELFVYPIERGYVACCQGRLFESVTLDRFKMDPNMAFQAITWEKQHLIVTPKAQFQEQVIKIVQDITSVFAERYQAYERLKKSL